MDYPEVELSPEQKEAVASLKDHIGFQILLDLVHATVLTVESRLEKANEPDEMMQELRFWQALRKVYSVIKSAPEEIYDQIAAELEARRNSMMYYRPPVK